jgi:hypothetical protein
MKSHTLFRTVTVRPSIPLVVDVTANNFYIESSTDKVGVAFNEQGSFQMDSGKTVELPDGDSFQKITFTNPTTTDIVLTFYAGSLRIGTRTPYVYVRPAPTYIVPTNPVITSAGTTISNRNTKAGAVKADNLSRIIVQNPGSNGSTYIEMYIGAVQIAIIAPGETWQLETSDSIILKPNPSAGTPTGLVSAFYDSPS